MKTVSSMRVRDCEIVYRTRKVDAVVRRFHSSEDVYRLLYALNATQRVTESIWVLLLDARQRLLGVHECARGGVAAVPVEAQEIFRAAIVIGARAIILAHNHPSGEATPSREDHAFTARVLQASELLGIPARSYRRCTGRILLARRRGRTRLLLGKPPTGSLGEAGAAVA